MSDRTLGMRWEVKKDESPGPVLIATDLRKNTRHSLWEDRWPAIALQECIDKVEEAPDELKVEVKRGLPCAECSEQSRCLNAKRKELGSLMYSREIQTDPRTSDSSLFPADLIGPMKNRGDTLVPFWRKPFSREHEYAVVQAWDLAWSERTGGDWLVFMCAMVHLPTGQKRLLDVQRWQAMSFPQQIELIKAKYSKYDTDLVVIEADAAQSIWSQQVTLSSDVPVLPHTSGGKGSFEMGVPSLIIQFENRKWEFPNQHDSYHQSELETFFTELEAFGWVDGKLQGVGEHDDTVMCFWHLNWGLMKFTRESMSEQYRGVQDGREP